MSNENTSEMILSLIGVIEVEIAKHGKSNGVGHRDAAYGLATHLEIWKAGLKQAIPKQFEPYLEKASRNIDPEYLEYCRLREKFEKDVL